jgi:rubrerythrin
MEHCCKVAKARDKYGLDEMVTGGDIDRAMLARWKGWGGYEETGVRPLVEWFNKLIITSVYQEAGRSALDTQIDPDYEALTSDDEGQRKAKIQELENEGIDAEEMAGDFAARATLYRHFNNCLEEEKPKKRSENSGEDGLRTAKDQFKRVFGDTLDHLDRHDKLPHASKADLNIQVVLSCPVCGTSVEYERALERGYICEDHMSETDQLPTNDKNGTDIVSSDATQPTI